MMRALSKSQSRNLAVGLLILCLLAGGLLVFVPVKMLHAHYGQWTDNRVDSLMRYRRIEANSAEIRSALEQVKKQGGRQHFLQNTGAALAASEIQEAAKNLIEANGGRLNSMQVVPFKDEGDYHRITVNVQLVSNIAALRKILYTLETMQPYLLVDNMSIRSPVNVLRKDVSASEPEVTAQFDLSGYALTGDAK